MSEILLVVANGSCARLLRGGAGLELKEIQVMHNPLAKLHLAGFVTSRPEKVPKPDSSRGAAGSAENTRRKEYLRRYSRRVSHAIAMEINKAGIQKIILVATPLIVTVLREKLNKRFIDKIVYTLKKDLVDKNITEVLKALPVEYQRNLAAGFVKQEKVS